MKGRAALVTLLSAESISSIGSKMSFLAIPWLVLVTTGSPTKMGLVGLFQTLPYVFAGIFATPLVDRIGMRTVSILNDTACAALIASIALFARHDFLILLGLASLVGSVTGVGDRAKRMLLQPLSDMSGTPMARVVAIVSSTARINTVLGVAIGGFVIAWVGPIGALWIDSASYAFCALSVLALVHIPPAHQDAKPEREPYVQSLKAGYAFLKEDKLLPRIVRMMFVTNLFNQASGVVLVPLWVMHHFGSPVALGWVTGAVALGGIIGNLALIGLVTKLPRYISFVIGYLLAGGPRFLVLGLTGDLKTVLIVSFLSGIASSTINPAYGSLLFERVPRNMQARVFGLTGAMVFGGIPLGGLVGAWFVEGLGLRGGMILAGICYMTITLSPIIGYRIWRRMDDTAPGAAGQSDLVDSVAHLVHRTLPPAVTGALQKPVEVSLVYTGREWTVAFGGTSHAIAPQTALQAVKQLDVAPVYDTVERLQSGDLARDLARAEQLRAALAVLDLGVNGSVNGSVNGNGSSPNGSIAKRAISNGQRE
jgi:MFS family permease